MDQAAPVKEGRVKPLPFAARKGPTGPVLLLLRRSTVGTAGTRGGGFGRTAELRRRRRGPLDVVDGSLLFSLPPFTTTTPRRPPSWSRDALRMQIRRINRRSAEVTETMTTDWA